MTENEKELLAISGDNVFQTKYLTVKDFSEQAGVTPQRIYQLISKGQIKNYKTLQGHKFICEDELKPFPKYVLSNTNEPDTQETTKETDLQDLQTDSPDFQSNLQDFQANFQDLQSDLQDLKGEFSRFSEFEQIYKGQIEALQQQIATLTAEVTAKNEQIAVKDTQIATLQAHTDDLTATLTSMQGNINTLTEALSTAQALHAGTIKGQLIEQSERSDSKSEEVAIVEEQPKHWWQKLFRKK